MKSEELIKRLKGSRCSVFSLGDIVKISNKDENYVKVLVDRLIKRKLLIRIEKNKYSLPNENPFSVASLLTFPSYVSLISAYSYYGLTTQIPSTVFVVSLRQKREVLYNGYRIKFVKFSRERLFGYSKDYAEGKIVFVAEVEKAILDSLLLPKYCPLTETFNAIREASLNHEKLLDYTRKFNSKVVAKRLGYLLDVVGLDFNSRLRGLVNKNYEPLNPLKPTTGNRDEKWRIVVNEVLE
ncbi:MAG: hypothetical protein QXF26_00635 [Candidatus Bathyarchaeia archaeon]